MRKLQLLHKAVKDQTNKSQNIEFLNSTRLEFKTQFLIEGFKNLQIYFNTCINNCFGSTNLAWCEMCNQNKAWRSIKKLYEFGKKPPFNAYLLVDINWSSISHTSRFWSHISIPIWHRSSTMWYEKKALNHQTPFTWSSTTQWTI